MPVVVRRLLVLLAVAGAGLIPAPATAAGYCAGSGVNVVVDFGAIGGATEKGCGSGSTAADVFRSAGVDLKRDAQYQGVVCKVENLPTDANCATMPAGNAYWGLYWSDGTSGHWVYSSVGVDGLKVPSGGFVAFAWQSSTSQRTPSADPTNPRPAPTVSGSPTKAPTKKATSSVPKVSTTPRAANSSGGSSATAPASASASASPSATPTATASGSAPAAVATTAQPTPSATPSSASAAGPVETQSAATDGDGLPWWVPVLVLLALVIGGGTAWWMRRRPGAGQPT